MDDDRGCGFGKESRIMLEQHLQSETKWQVKVDKKLDTIDTKFSSWLPIWATLLISVLTGLVGFLLRHN
jgi:hypothetical protein